MMNRSVKIFSRGSLSVGIQCGISVLVVVLVALISSSIKQFIGYQGVALILLMVVSILGMALDIWPVILAAVLSALIWNFFFIPPLFTFNIDNTEDLLLFLMYFFIASLNAVLTYKIRVRNKKIRDKEENEKAISLYDSILNSLSHELRTPISTIMGAVDAMKEQNGTLSSLHKSELMEEISKASLRLNHQVENLLNLSRLEAGMVRLKLDWVDINELMHRVVQKFTTIDNTHQIIFNPAESLPLFKLDSILIEQVLYNIIQNSFLYTPAGSTITITTSFEKEKCCITISDNGPGFPENEIKPAFNKFYRLSQSKFGGTGLGLSIVKGFVEAHDGTVELTNNMEGGSEF
jgi:two-component system sensor histidine kinase KdpD